jgi:uncharacterized protein
MPTRSSGSVKLFYPRFDRQSLVSVLKQGLVALSQRMPLKRAVLFGSWAQGRATAFSDIDLLVIYSDPPRGDAYQEVRRCMDIPGLEPHVYSETEAAQLVETLSRMTANGIDLLGERLSS